MKLNMSKSITNCINLLKNNRGSYGLQFNQGAIHEISIGDEKIFLLSNNAKKVLEFTDCMGNAFTTKTQFLIFTTLPESVKECKMIIEHGESVIRKESINYDKRNIQNMPTRLRDEFLNETFKLSLSDYTEHGYLFAVPLREDLAEVLQHRNIGDNVSFFIHDEKEPNGEFHVRTVLNSKYDAEAKIFYTDSWSYIQTCIKSFETKVETMPMILLRNQKDLYNKKLNELYYLLRNTESVKNLDLATQEIDKFIKIAKKEIVYA